MPKKNHSSQHTPELLFKGLTKSFGDRVVLSNLSLEVKQGESLVIIGRSGAGKSVLLKCVLGLIEPDAGDVLIAGKNSNALSTADSEKLFQSIGVVFQSSALFDSLTVLENIAFRLHLSEKERQKRVSELLLAVGLPDHTADLYPSELSGGMKHRVALARALALQPKILFFDEPTGGLDPIATNIISTLIRKCTRDINATTVTITHDLTTAKTIGDTVALLDQGRIAWQGKTEDLDTTKNAYIHQFITGNPKGPLSAIT